MAQRQAVQAWLDRVEIITDDGLAALSIGDRADLESLLGSNGMKLLLGLMMGTRQGLMMELAHQPLHTPDLAARASVTQGKIKGIDLLPQTLLELTVPSDAANEGAIS